MQQQIRPAAVAGMFYPDSRSGLAAEVERLIAHAPSAEARRAPKAIIAPHAGYIYSGPIAAAAYAQLRSVRSRITRVVLLGPCHRVPVRGLALPDATAFQTPLGQVQIDIDAMRALSDLPQVITSAAAHALEHSLEVQLPFLQTVLNEFKVVPLVVGWATAQDVAEVIERLWGGAETLIVISSDLSHYHSYDEARAIDSETCRAILDLSPDIDHEQACGATPVAGLVLAAQRRDLHAELLDLRNSADTAGDKRHVVGYASFAFREQAQGVTDDRGEVLLRLARASVSQAVGGPAVEIPQQPWLLAHAATFVTLMQHGELRGCIGAVEAVRPLGEDVIHNARAAAMDDPRFAPLRRADLPQVEIEVSQLSPLEPLEFEDEAQLLSLLRPGVDGLTLSCGGRQATFLPQVWEKIADPALFLAELKRKAYLPVDTPSRYCVIMRYTVEKWRERGERAH